MTVADTVWAGLEREYNTLFWSAMRRCPLCAEAKTDTWECWPCYDAQFTNDGGRPTSSAWSTIRGVGAALWGAP